MMDNLEELRSKISTLLKKTAENGASEAEADAAMRHASKLMKKYGITLDEIKNNPKTTEDFIFRKFTQGSSRLHYVDKLVTKAISEYTDTKSYVDRSQGDRRVTFYGYPVDVELAGYIRTVCKDAVDAEWKKFSRSLPRGSRAKLRKSFMVGMCSRLAQRLRAYKLQDAEQTGSTSLVVVKNQLVTKSFSEKIGGLKKAKTIKYNNNFAADAGRKAAENVRFNREFNDQSSVRRLKA